MCNRNRPSTLESWGLCQYSKFLLDISDHHLNIHTAGYFTLALSDKVSYSKESKFPRC